MHASSSRAPAFMPGVIPAGQTIRVPTGIPYSFQAELRWDVVIRRPPGINAGGNPTTGPVVAMTTTQDKPVSGRAASHMADIARGYGVMASTASWMDWARA